MDCPKCKGNMAEERESDFYGSTTFFKCLVCRKMVCQLEADVQSDRASAPMNKAEDPELFV
jgi:hypothetical protein